MELIPTAHDYAGDEAPARRTAAVVPDGRRETTTKKEAG